MSEENEVFEEGNQVSVFFRDRETRTAMGIYALVLMLVTAKIFYSLAIKDSYLHDEVRFEDNWRLSFTEETSTLSETVLLPDGGEEDLEFVIDLNSFSDGYRIGLVEVKISYSETNQAILTTLAILFKPASPKRPIPPSGPTRTTRSTGVPPPVTTSTSCSKSTPTTTGNPTNAWPTTPWWRLTSGLKTGLGSAI